MRYIQNPENGAKIDGFLPDGSFSPVTIEVGDTVEVDDRTADNLLKRFEFLKEIDKPEKETKKVEVKRKETTKKKSTSKKSDPQDKDNDLDDGEGGTEELTVGDNEDDEEDNDMGYDENGVRDEPSTTVKEGEI